MSSRLWSSAKLLAWVWSAASLGLLMLMPTLASAHGDDEVTATTFIGPMLAFVLVVSVVVIGRELVRSAKGKGK
jgi:hypothetical protein